MYKGISGSQKIESSKAVKSVGAPVTKPPLRTQLLTPTSHFQGPTSPLSAGRFHEEERILLYVFCPEPLLFLPFSDPHKVDDLPPTDAEDYIHRKIQQRNDRKSPSTIPGIIGDYDLKKKKKT